MYVLPFTDVRVRVGLGLTTVMVAVAEVYRPLAVTVKLPEALLGMCHASRPKLLVSLVNLLFEAMKGVVAPNVPELTETIT